MIGSVMGDRPLGLVIGLIVATTVACSTGGDGGLETDPGSGAEGAAPTATAFPDAPMDGPMPEIGPAPDDYQPTAAGAPSTDIWMGTLVRSEDGLRVEGLVNATDRDGYDNQPSFGPDGVLYFVSAIDRAQTEVLRRASGDPRQAVTRTAGASEFSPTPIPGQDAISAIREERGKQYLWRYSTSGVDLGPIFATAEPVGYHAWATETIVVMFILGAPPTLRIGDASTGRIRMVAENPGRSIHRIPSASDVSFVRKVADDEWWIERMDPVSGRAERIVQTLPGREDYAWTPAGEILMGDGSVLHAWSADTGWSRLQDLGPQGVHAISRIAISPDGSRIAIVTDRE